MRFLILLFILSFFSICDFALSQNAKETIEKRKIEKYIELGSGDFYINDTVGFGTNTAQTGLHYQNDSAIFRISDNNSTSTTSAISYLEFYDRNNTARLGYVGFGSGSNDTLYLDSENGDIQLEVEGSSTILLDGAVTINESGADKDFRVESSAIANGLFFEGSSGRLGLGTNSPSGSLHLKPTSEEPDLIIDSPSGSYNGNLSFYEAGVNKWSLEYNYSSESLTWFDDSSNAIFTMDADGNVAVGASSSVGKFNAVTTGSAQVIITDSDVNGTGEHWYYQNSGGDLYLGSSTNASGDFSSLVDRFIITKEGRFGVGGSASSNRVLQVTGATSSNVAIVKTPSNGVGNLQAFSFQDGGGEIGNILMDTTGNTTAYNTTSDMRLKNDLGSWDGVSIIKKVTPRKFERKSNKGIVEYGFFAQELYKTLPQAVTVGGEDVNYNPWMVDYSKTTAVLWKAIQEQQEIIEKQKEKNDLMRSWICRQPDYPTALCGGE